MDKRMKGNPGIVGIWADEGVGCEEIKGLLYLCT